MAEHELAKRAENIAETIQDPKKTAWGKIGKIVLEVLIIVFAISFSLFLERRREKKHDKAIEKEFLTELRSDLTNKIKELRQDSTMYANIKSSWKYMYDVSTGSRSPEADSIEAAGGSFNYVLLINSNNSLFESIKASGNLHVIRNKELLQKIMHLYQENMPSLIKSIDMVYYRSNNQIAAVLNVSRTHKKEEDNLTDLLLHNNTLSNLLSKYYEIGIITGFYRQAIENSIQIIEMIDQQIH